MSLEGEEGVRGREGGKKADVKLKVKVKWEVGGEEVGEGE
jgi:hypothetical protein